MNSIILYIILALNAFALGISAFYPTDYSPQHTIMYCSIILLTQIALEKNND